VKWYIKRPFDGIFTQQYLYQKLLESDNYVETRWWLSGILFWDTVYIFYQRLYDKQYTAMLRFSVPTCTFVH